ncbi:MAG: diguanylate cyclase [Deltaproteobacteria bacterium]|nr:diguanylate cyclase [Deltaproteobacteria bacterium]
MEYFSKQSKLFLIVLGFVIVLLFGVIDYITGPDISFSIFYLLPISLVVWFAGKRSGILMSIISALAWYEAYISTVHSYSFSAIFYWNAVMRLGLFLIVTYILSALKRALEKEKALARMDPLTEIANRRQFFESVDIEINRARRYKRPLTVTYVDIDDFKIVNDRFGHLTGDNLLRLVAETIKDNIRVVDVVSRLGGDEFAILLPETGPESSKLIVHRVQKKLLDAVHQNGWPVTFSIGVVTYTIPPSPVDKMLNEVDGLMYSVKNSNKNMIKYKVLGGPTEIAQ